MRLTQKEIIQAIADYTAQKQGGNNFRVSLKVLYPQKNNTINTQYEIVADVEWIDR